MMVSEILDEFDERKGRKRKRRRRNVYGNAFDEAKEHPDRPVDSRMRDLKRATALKELQNPTPGGRELQRSIKETLKKIKLDEQQSTVQNPPHDPIEAESEKIRDNLDIGSFELDSKDMSETHTPAPDQEKVNITQVEHKEVCKDHLLLNDQNPEIPQSKSNEMSISLKKKDLNGIDGNLVEAKDLKSEIQDQWKQEFNESIALNVIKNKDVMNILYSISSRAKYSVSSQELGPLLKFIQKKLNLTDKNLAGLIGMKRTSIYRILDNRRGLNLGSLLGILNRSPIQNLDQNSLQVIKYKIGRILTDGNTLFHGKKHDIRFIKRILDLKSGILDQETIEVPRFGIGIPAHYIKEGGLNQFLRGQNITKKLTLRSPELIPLLAKLCVKIEKSPRFLNTVGIFFDDLKAKRSGVNLHKLLQLPNVNHVREMLSKNQINRLERDIQKMILAKDTRIKRFGSHESGWNYFPPTLDQMRIGDQDFIFFPRSYLESRERQKNVSPLDKQSNIEKPDEDSTVVQVAQSEIPKELRGTIDRTLENDFVKYGYGIIVSSNIIDEGRLNDWLRESGALQGYFIKNPELGPLLRHVCDKLGLKKTDFNQLINAGGGAYKTIFKNERGVDIQNLVQFPEKLTKEQIEKLTQRNLAQEEAESLNKIKLDLKNKIERILLSDESSIYKGNVVWNFKRENLKKIKIGATDALILPTSKWEIPTFRNQVVNAVYTAYQLSSLFNPLFGKDGRAPSHRELYKYFKGFCENEKRYSRTHNDFIESLGIKPNQRKLFNWSKPESWDSLKLFIQGCYFIDSLFSIISGTNIAPPTKMDCQQFGAFTDYLYKNGIPGNGEINTFRKLLRSWEIPVYDKKRELVEGIAFDSVGQDCLELINPNAIKKPYIFSPLLKDFDKHFISPDGIVHDSVKKPLDQNRNTFYLKGDQRVDVMIDFKRTYGSMELKDKKIYTRLSHELHIFLLRGYARPQKINNCKIIFHPRKELYSLLQNCLTPENQNEINALIQRIQEIYHGYYYRKYKKNQKTLDRYLQYHSG